MTKNYEIPSGSTGETAVHLTDLIPDVYQEKPIASYKDWSPETTKVITYCLDVEGRFPGIFAENRSAAEAHCKANYGRIVEANYVPGRAFLRVRKSA